jgi:hypothetical protein
MRYVLANGFLDVVSQGKRTRRQALLQLLGLIGVLEDQGVQVSLASDLELDVLGLCALLDPGS